MRKIYYYYHLFLPLFLGFFSALLNAQNTTPSEVLELLKNVPPKESFPNADFYVVAETTHLRLLPDDTYEKEFYKLIKSFTYGGKKQLSNYKIVYSSDWEDVEILLARTINIDSCYNVAEKEINVISHPSYRGSAMYGRVEQKVVTFSNFTDTSVIEIRYRIRCKNQPKVPFDGIHLLADENPRGVSILTLSFPDYKPVNYLEINGLSKGKKTDKGIIWELKNWAGFKPEPNMPPMHELFPGVIYTRFRNWGEAGEFVASRILAKAIPSEVITALADSLSQGKDGVRALESILFYIQEKMEHIRTTPALFGYSSREPSGIISQGYGDNKDLCVLLIAMLKARKIESSLVMLSGTKVYDFPCLSQFSEFAVLTNINGEDIFLKPDCEFCSVNYLGNKRGEKALVIQPGGGNIIDIPVKPDENRAVFHFDLTVNPSGGLTGSVITSGEGKSAAEIRELFRNVRRRQLKQILENAVSDVASGAKLLRDTLYGIGDNSTNPEVGIWFSAEKYATLQGNMVIFWLPRVPFELVYFPNILASERKLPLFINEPFVFEETFLVRTPEGWKIDYIPPTTTIETTGGSVKIESSLDENTVKISIMATIEKKRIQTGDYEEFRKMLKSLFAKRNKIILLEKEL